MLAGEEILHLLSFPRFNYLVHSSISQDRVERELDPTHTVTFLTGKDKECRNRPGVAQRVPGGLGSQIS